MIGMIPSFGQDLFGSIPPGFTLGENEHSPGIMLRCDGSSWAAGEGFQSSKLACKQPFIFAPGQVVCFTADREQNILIVNVDAPFAPVTCVGSLPTEGDLYFAVSQFGGSSQVELMKPSTGHTSPLSLPTSKGENGYFGLRSKGAFAEMETLSKGILDLQLS